MPKFTLQICQFPYPNQTKPAPTEWVCDLVHKIARNHPEISFCLWSKSDTPISMCRNKAIRDAMKNGVDAVLMIDSDMEIDPKGRDGNLLYPGARPFFDVAWDWFLKHRDDPCAIAAPYVGGGMDHNNVFVFLWRQRTNNPNTWSLEQFSREEAAMRGGVEEVAALPTGVILYDTRMFARMKKPFFYYEYTDDWESDKASTEDVTNTRDLSLAWYASSGEVGGKVYCAWDCWANHIKECHIPKPRLLGPSDVADSLKQAVKHGVNRNERLVMVGGSPVQPARPLDANGRFDRTSETVPTSA